MFGVWAVESIWACDPSAIGRARAWTLAQLEPLRTSATEQRVNDAVLCVSELATNAFNAGSTSMNLALELHDHTLRVSLKDNADGWPTRRHPNKTDPRGRGLLLVAAMSRTWGTTSVPTGKVVWAALDW